MSHLDSMRYHIICPRCVRGWFAGALAKECHWCSGEVHGHRVDDGCLSAVLDGAERFG